MASDPARRALTEHRLLLAPLKQVADTLFVEAVRKAAASSGAEAAFALPSDALGDLAHATDGGLSPPRWQATMSFQTDEVAGVRQAINDLASFIDPVSSSAVVGERHRILPGENAVRMSFFLRRLDSLTARDFHQYWLNVHVKFGLELVPPHFYDQFHVSTDKSASLNALLGLANPLIDGIGDVFFPSLEILTKHIARSPIADRALIDERNFIDHSKSSLGIYGCG